MKVAVIGLGKMGTALALGLHKSGKYEVLASTLHPEKHKEVEELGVRILPSNVEAARNGEVVIIAVKPVQVKGVVEEVKEAVKGKLVISIAAAITIDFLESLIPEARVIRAMPNLAAMVREAVTAIALGKRVTRSDVETAMEIFKTIGDCLIVDEKLMDMITGVSGSGPAYAFVVIDALADAGVKAGLPKDLALELVAKTMLGASKMVLELNKHPIELRDMVVTPGGVTIMAMYELEKYGFRAALMDAVEAAIKRAGEIRKALSDNRQDYL
ncbi:MAG: pyrroline-5-carboxylate reductase [Candidatus Nezhaarchaeales archaeon]